VATISGGTTSFEYGTLDSPLREIAPNGIETLYTYDELGIVEGIEVRDPWGGTLARWDYTYDALYLPQQVTTVDGVWQYDYDAVGRIVRAEDPFGGVESYTYDGVGNRTASSSVPEYRYDAMHRLEGYGDVSLTYDADGNLLTRSDGLGTTTYTHDAVNRLTQVDLPGGDQVRYGYDTWRFRYYKEINGATTYYFHAPFLMAEYDAAGSPLRSYTRHPVTGEILQFHDHTSGRTYFVHRDALGTPRLLTDNTGGVAWDAEYDPFGTVIVAPGNTVEFNPRYLGQYFDGETGLHYNLKRYYDPETGRYIEPDPLSTLENTGWYMNPSRHEYVYARNNPLRFRDVYGLCDQCDDCPSGAWRGVAVGGDAMLAVIGGSSSFVSMICSDASVRARFRVHCVRIGAGLGLGLAPGGVFGVGCNRSELRESLSGWGAFGSFSLGVVGVSASHSLTSLGVGTISGGLSVGLEAAVGTEHCWVY
jgi:RHS repeat-associated protein